MPYVIYAAELRAAVQDALAKLRRAPQLPPGIRLVEGQHIGVVREAEARDRLARNGHYIRAEVDAWLASAQPVLVVLKVRDQVTYVPYTLFALESL